MKMPFYTQNFHRSQEPENGVGLVWFLCFSSSVDQSIGRFVSAGQRPGEACPSQPPVQSQATSHSQFRVPDLVPSPFPFPCPVHHCHQNPQTLRHRSRLCQQKNLQPKRPVCVLSCGILCSGCCLVYVFIFICASISPILQLHI